MGKHVPPIITYRGKPDLQRIFPVKLEPLLKRLRKEKKIYKYSWNSTFHKSQTYGVVAIWVYESKKEEVERFISLTQRLLGLGGEDV